MFSSNNGQIPQNIRLQFNEWEQIFTEKTKISFLLPGELFVQSTD